MNPVFLVAAVLALTTPADALQAGGQKDHAGHGQGEHADHHQDKGGHHEQGKHTFTGPLSKGLEAFHDTLHPLWHESYPKKDYVAIKGKLPELRRRARDLVAVPLPPGARAKRAQRDALLKAIDSADAVKQDDKKFGKAFARVHDAFEALHEMGAQH